MSPQSIPIGWNSAGHTFYFRYVLGAYGFFNFLFFFWLFLKFNFVTGPLRGTLLCASEGIQYHLIKLLLQTQRKQGMWTQDNTLYKQGVL